MVAGLGVFSVLAPKAAAADFILERSGAAIPIGDTLTVIQRPLLNIPAFAMPGDTLPIECDAPSIAYGWKAELVRNRRTVPLETVDSTYDISTMLWTIQVALPDDLPSALYDLAISAMGVGPDTTRHAVCVIPEFKNDYYFIHITDTHLPTHLYYYQPGALTDSSEMVDLREVIADINLINPEFVLLTGDLVNEGELETYLGARYYTRAQRMLTEFQVPVFLTAGNHDLGGWSSTPPPAGTARRDWWRFFGWKMLAVAPPGRPWHTQNYSFDYGPVHYAGLEAYDNYDGWRYATYGGTSFTAVQMQWLAEDLAAASGSAARVLFYHYDFARQLNLSNLGVDMGLWGHIHRDQGNTSSRPFNLATNNLCDGERSYRLVRVSGGNLTPTQTLSAGYSGANLRVEFEPPNDGKHYTTTAYITNNQNQRFEHALLRFNMPAVCESLTVTGGSLVSIEDLGSSAIYCVGVDILPAGSQQVTIELDSTTAIPDTTGPALGLWLGLSHPNPFGFRTTLSFELPQAGYAELTVYDVRGRKVAALVQEYLPAGPYTAEWNGLDSRGHGVAPGVYLARLSLGGQARIRKLVFTR
jgi:hypothetical protein